MAEFKIDGRMKVKTLKEKFKEELETDYTSAQESYKDAPYKDFKEFEDEVFKFMYTEGYVAAEYEEGEDGKKDRTKIKELTPQYPNSIKSKEDAIDYVYNDKIATQLDMILTYWATANELATEYAAKAKEGIRQCDLVDSAVRRSPQSHPQQGPHREGQAPHRRRLLRQRLHGPAGRHRQRGRLYLHRGRQAAAPVRPVPPGMRHSRRDAHSPRQQPDDRAAGLGEYRLCGGGR